MASSWLFLALRMDNTAAVNLKDAIVQGTLGAQGKYLARRGVAGIQKLLNRAMGGFQQGQMWATVLASDATKSTGAIACTRANAASDTVTFTFGTKTVVLTEGVDFLRGATDTTCAAALAAAINANTILGGVFTAVGSTGNCNLTAQVPTALIHDFAMSTNDGTAFAFTQMTGGNEGTAQFILQKFDMGGPP